MGLCEPLRGNIHPRTGHSRPAADASGFSPQHQSAETALWSSGRETLKFPKENRNRRTEEGLSGEQPAEQDETAGNQPALGVSVHGAVTCALTSAKLPGLSFLGSSRQGLAVSFEILPILSADSQAH